jgi:hypothetical protein
MIIRVSAMLVQAHLSSRSSRGSFCSPGVGVLAQFVPTPGLLCTIVLSHTHTSDMLLHVIKSEPRCGSCSPICSHTAATIAPAAPIQSYPEFKRSPAAAPYQSCICCDAKVKFAPCSFATPTPLLHRS